MRHHPRTTCFLQRSFKPYPRPIPPRRCQAVAAPITTPVACIVGLGDELGLLGWGKAMQDRFPVPALARLLPPMQSTFTRHCFHFPFSATRMTLTLCDDAYDDRGSMLVRRGDGGAAQDGNPEANGTGQLFGTQHILVLSCTPKLAGPHFGNGLQRTWAKCSSRKYCPRRECEYSTKMVQKNSTETGYSVIMRVFSPHG